MCCFFCRQPPTPEQLEVDLKIENIKKEISDLVAEVSHLPLMLGDAVLW